MKGNHAPWSVRIIADRAAAYFGYTPEEFLERHADRPNLHRARQVAMHVAFNNTAASYSEIGAAFARDHTTVIYSCKTIDRLIEEEPDGPLAQAAACIAITPATRAAEI